MAQIEIKCRKIIGGSAAGEALVSRDGIGTYGSLDENTGIVTERNHSIFGKSITDKIFVFPFAKGSSAWGVTFHNLRTKGNQPRAMLIGIIDSKSAIGAIACNVPTVTDFAINPLDVIATGDWVEVDADQGVVYVTKQ